MGRFDSAYMSPEDMLKVAFAHTHTLHADPAGSGLPGPTGPQGPQGIQGIQGPAGQGVPIGGTAGMVLRKKTGTNYDTEWVDLLAIVYAQAKLDAHPVGSFFESADPTSPATLFGGTWVAVRGVFLFAEDASHVAGSTGGALTHTLVAGEMPVHTHVQDSHNHGQSAHNHGQDSHNHGQNSHNHTQDQHAHTYGIPPQWATNKGTSTVINISDTPVGTTYLSKVTGNTTATNQPTTAVNVAATAVNQSATAVNVAATAVNQNTGGGGAHNNMPPYLAVYRWRRTA